MVFSLMNVVVVVIVMFDSGPGGSDGVGGVGGSDSGGEGAGSRYINGLRKKENRRTRNSSGKGKDKWISKWN